MGKFFPHANRTRTQTQHGPMPPPPVQRRFPHASRNRCADTAINPCCPRLCRNAVSDVHEPPEYNWWTRLSLRKEPETENEVPPSSAPAADTDTEKAADRPLGLRLGTFHRALGKNDDPVLVERAIHAHLEHQRRRHEETNLMRRADARLRKEASGQVNSLVVLLRSTAGASVARRGRVVRGSATLGIFESQHDLSGLKRFLEKRGAHVLWRGHSPGCFYGFKAVRYREGLEDTDELFFYKSVLIKAMDLPGPSWSEKEQKEPL